MSALSPVFEEALQKVTEKLSLREKGIREQNEKLEQLKKIVRDFCVVLQRWVERMHLPPSVFAYYKLTLSGRSPNPTRREEWVSIGKQLVRGDGHAVAKGFSPMLNPSAEEVKAALGAVQPELDQVAVVDRDYDKAQEVVADLRSRADVLIHKVMEELRFNLRNLDRPSRRRIMRTYGAKFRTINGEAKNINKGSADTVNY